VELTKDVIRGEGQEITVSAQELCQYHAAAEDKIRRQRALVRHSILPGVKKRKRSKTPPEMIAPGDEAKYIEQEERVAKRMADGDPDYQDTGLVKSSSE
jgi:hypothetical protein